MVRPKRQNKELIRDKEIKLHVNKFEKKQIEDHFGKGRVSRRIRDIVMAHIYECDRPVPCK